MGFFGSFLYAGGEWSVVDVDEVDEVPLPALLVAVHDSDIAFVSYLPVGPGTGTAYLGHTPRVYFENEEASPPTDPLLEAAALATWWGAVHEHGCDEVAAKAVEILPFLATDEVEDETGGAAVAAADIQHQDLPDDDVFVEVTLQRFLTVLDVPIPTELFEQA